MQPVELVLQPGFSSLQQQSPFEVHRILVGVSGGSAAGKTTLCEGVREAMQYDSEFDMTIISLDCFYKGIDKSVVEVKDYNFDHPDALDFDLAYSVLQTLLEGNPAQVPNYDFHTHSREDRWTVVVPSSMIFFEGILALYDERIRSLMHYKFFIHCDDDVRLCRRIIRDVKERGREVRGVLYQYNRFVKKAYESYIHPTMNYADIIIPASRQNHVSVSIIVNQLKSVSKQLGVLKLKMTNLLFFGDLLYTIDNIFKKNESHSESVLEISKALDSSQRMLFPVEETTKNELLFQSQLLTSGKTFTAKQYYKSIKSLQKQCLLILTKAFNFRQLDIQKILCIDFGQIIDGNNVVPVNIYNLDTTYKSYVMFTIPYMFKDHHRLMKTICQAFASYHPKVKLIIVNLFSEISQVISVSKDLPEILLLSNAFLVGRQEKFAFILRDRYQRDQSQSQQQLPDHAKENDLLSLSLESEKFYKKLVRFLEKRLKSIFQYQ